MTPDETFDAKYARYLGSVMGRVLNRGEEPQAVATGRRPADAALSTVSTPVPGTPSVEASSSPRHLQIVERDLYDWMGDAREAFNTLYDETLNPWPGDYRQMAALARRRKAAADDYARVMGQIAFIADQLADQED